MLKPDIEVVVSKDPLSTSLLLSTAKGYPPTVRAVPGLSACGGLGGKHHQIFDTGLACSATPDENSLAKC